MGDIASAEPRTCPAGDGPGVSIDLSAVVVAVTQEEPRVLALRTGARPALPSGPLEAEHRTLDMGLRSWVERQTDQRLNYVEQLYTFGDLDRREDGVRALSVAYLALVREAHAAGAAQAAWPGWYGFFPWEDWREGRPAVLDAIHAALESWARAAPDRRTAEMRRQRRRLAFSDEGAAPGPSSGSSWNDERVLERYELLYEAGLVAEAGGEDGGRAREAFREKPDPLFRPQLRENKGLEPFGDSQESRNALGRAMAFDHRRILATAIGRLRGKIKYRPVVFELMPPAFTLLQLQRAVEALSGMRLHKQNFRRLVETQGLVEETGETASDTGGRPARLVRFRPEVLLERPAPGVRPPAARR